MKRLLLILTLAAAAIAVPVAQTGCSSPPSARVTEVQTLKAVGQAAEAAVSLSAQLYAGGTINAVQARQVLDFYNQKFQPAFRLAAAAVQANLDSIASPDVVALASQLSTLVIQLQSHKP